ncbi:MAG TPA: TatD family hydrolase [Sphaerochaeta sp.]|nr:TatD family hydrolase [Sphaerochaeta sp.]
MFDAHRHLTDEKEVYDALYCTSCQNEWAIVANLPHPGIGALGALANKALANKTLPPIDALAQALQDNPLLQVGEIGLDKRFGDMEDQQNFLLASLDLAYSLERSVTVHVVQSDGLFLSCLGKAGSRLPTILWHAFTGSVETARIAARKGCILSLAPGIEMTRTARKLDEFSSLPFAIETDFDTTMQKSPYSQVLEDQYTLIGSLMHMDRETLIRNNRAKRAILTNNAPPR